MDWNRLKRITAPTVPAISLAEAKEHLRVDLVDEDPLIHRLTWAATQMVDGPHGIGLALVDQQWEMTLDCFPSVIKIPLYPVRSIDAIEYQDDQGNTQTLASSRYQVDTSSNPARIIPAYNDVWPTIRVVLNAVTVRFTAGYAPEGSDKRANIPEDIRAALLLIAGHLYENRTSVVMGADAAELPMGASHILSQYRVGRVR